MANSTFIQVPPNITDGQVLKRFLEKLILQIDIAFGNRGAAAFTPSTSFQQSITSIQDIQQAINDEAIFYSKLDGSRPYTDVVSYNGAKVFTLGTDIVDKAYVDSKFPGFGTTSGTVTEGGTTTNNPKQSAIATLGLTISAPPTEVQVQAVSDKVDSLIISLRNSNLINL